MHFLVTLSSAVLTGQTVLGALYVAPQQLPRTRYDFVVVGGGTAGNVIAARLSENPNFTVAVIEAGEDDEGILQLEIPLTAPSDLSNSSVMWPYITAPQPSFNNRTIPMQRGKILGGSSAVNFMFWTRGSQDDFDRIARVTNDSGWSWKSILPYYKKLETFTPPVDHHNTTGQFDPSIHGFSGPLLTTLPGYPSDVDPRILATTQDDSHQFPFNLDMNGGNPIGIGWTQSTAGGGKRSSSATAYIHPNIKRPNLDVLLGAQVTRLLTSNTTKGSTPTLRTVEFAQSSNGPRTTIQATKEVILSAGAINTPQILQLSGVGNSEELKPLGIKPVVNSPYVGEALQDHPLLEMKFFSTENFTIDSISRNATLAEELIDQWSTNLTGPLVDVPSNMFGWLRLNQSVLGAPDPSAGPTSPHIEFLPLNAFSPFRETPPATGSFFTVITNVASPTSRGTVKIRSSNPFDFPVIDPAYLTEQVDLNIIIGSINVAKSFVSQVPWKGIILQPCGQLGTVETQEELVGYVKNQTVGFWHVCCTAKMGSEGDSSAVVDSKLRVKGVGGVRVVDASVFPYIPAAHPQGPIYAVAERAADIIKAAYDVSY